ncbi:MAG: right-handed parallel beta-helix repeat-containing protein [Armatimonadetes bacterium]|nr:right-handed parallel beta-helix repeat-containing protein [Armatimonadota bacterium]
MLSFLLMSRPLSSDLPEVTLKPGLVIKSSCRIKPGDYLVAGGESPAKAAIRIEGDNITIDFRDAVLRGTPADSEPDKRAGFGISARGKNIEITGATVRGFKVGLYAESAAKFKLIDGDFSYNWKAHLKSGRLKEDLSDWMSYHHNESDEWFGYGAGIYLKSCTDFEVRGNTITGGGNGLMMANCSKGLVWNNEFTFLSSLGIGMYRSSHNRIMHNNIDWCVRGYSHRFYNRGQDSAGLLMYEQSSNNTVAYNSITHGGDGLFLWAGQTTMDTGKGGCNDNLFYGNDFSHAPTNGIEATFSRNKFVNNLVLECWHGVWGGYSYNSDFIGNVFGLNGEAIAIEHGQENRIIANAFFRDTVGINLWRKESEDPEWGYPKNHDTRSRDYVIGQNAFAGIGELVYSITRTENVSFSDNSVETFGKIFELGPGNSGLNDQGSDYRAPDETIWPEGVKRDRVEMAAGPKGDTYMGRNGLVLRRGGNEKLFADTLRQISWNPVATTNDMVRRSYVAPLDGGNIPFLGMKARRGRTEILVDEWGPVDFRSPVLWLEDWYDTPDQQKYYVFRVVGPKGKWTLEGVENGVYLKMDPAWNGVIPAEPPFMNGPLTGLMDDRILVKSPGQFKVAMTYVGAKTVDYRGIETPAGRTVAFGYADRSIPVSWSVDFFNYDRLANDPRKDPEAFRKIYETEPAASMRTQSLDGAWSGSPMKGVNADGFATLAEGRATTEAGAYTLTVTSDDGVRVLVDGKVVFEDWTWHGPKSEEIRLKLEAGRHTFRIEHFELDGYSTLQARLSKD